MSRRSEVVHGLLDDLAGRFRGREGRAWAGSVEDLLFDGETVRRTVDLEGNRVVVTSHRVLAFTPGTDDENYHRVDLPNVSDVDIGHDGEANLLRYGARAAVYGAILVAIGVFVDFGAFVPTDAFAGTSGASGRLGLGGVLETMNALLGLIARLDEFARIGGAVLVLFAVFVLGVYLLTRDRVVVVTVAGDDPDIHVPAPDEGAEEAVADLEAVLFERGGEADGAPLG